MRALYEIQRTYNLNCLSILSRIEITSIIYLKSQFSYRRFCVRYPPECKETATRHIFLDYPAQSSMTDVYFDSIIIHN